MPAFSNGAFSKPTPVGIANFGSGTIGIGGYTPSESNIPGAPDVPVLHWFGQNWFIGGKVITETIADATE